MRLDKCIRKRWLWFGLYAGIWTLLTLLSVASMLSSEKSCRWGPCLRQEFKDWYSCGLLSLGIIWFCGRNQLEPGRMGRWVTAHLAGTVVFWAAFTTFTSWLVAGEESIMHPGQVLTFSYLVEKLALNFLLTSVLVYWLVVCCHLGWHYYQRYREREVQTAQLQRELVEARLDALRMQLNPHFLFNTLHSVSALIHQNPEAADRVLARLSELLRLSLDQSKPQEVSLSEEMAFLDRYLEIEQARFADRLTVEKDVGPEVQNALVPYLILQPLVENAIRHGIEPREDMGHLMIRARRTNGRLELRVSDNGTGLPDEAEAPRREGIGLSNTRSRLRHLYGDDHSFELARAPQGGLEARIDIPYHTETVTT